jgi:GNAT superfamily N-acetyltransferase
VTIEIPPARLSDALRSELIFLPGDGSLAPVDDGTTRALRMLTPSNPTYWWGNSLRMDAPPRDGDFGRWMALFDATIRALQPESIHHTFAWDGDERGVVAPFVAAGFEWFETISMGVARASDVAAPHPTARAIVPVDDRRWDPLVDLLVATRGPDHSEHGYRTYLQPRVRDWQALEAEGRGRWFCVEDDDGRVVSALGVFAEARAGADGRRIGRFQLVMTHPDARRQGLAGSLVAHASRYALDRLGVADLRISADANDVARRIYEACGYRVRSRLQGLERGS